MTSITLDSIDPGSPERQLLSRPDAQPDPHPQAGMTSTLLVQYSYNEDAHDLAGFPELNHVDDLLTETPWESQTSNELCPGQVSPYVEDGAKYRQGIHRSCQREDVTQRLDGNRRVDRCLLKRRQIGADKAYLIEEAESK